MKNLVAELARVRWSWKSGDFRYERFASFEGNRLGSASDEASGRLTRWVREHARPIRAFLMLQVRNATVVDDLLQEVFCRAWESADRYVDCGNERGYLLRIADRLACDHWRRARREIAVETESWDQLAGNDPEAEPFVRLAQREEAELLETALAALSGPQRRTLLLRYYGGLSFREIADILDCPLNTALSHARRGLESLRQRLPLPFEVQ